MTGVNSTEQTTRDSSQKLAPRITVGHPDASGRPKGRARPYKSAANRLATYVKAGSTSLKAGMTSLANRRIERRMS